MKKIAKTPVKKVTRPRVAKKVTPKVSMTVKQAQTLQKALGTKSYAFLNKKISEVSNG